MKIIHPFLFAVLPTLFLFFQNINLLRFKEALAIWAVTLIAISILFFVALFFLKDRKKTAIFISLWVILFFSYGYFKDFIDGAGFAESWFTRHRYLILLWVVFGSGSLWLAIKIKKDLSNLNSIFSIVACALILVFSIKTFADKFLKPTISPIEISSGVIFPPSVKDGTIDLPDIYYINPDAYANTAVLKKFFNYDNKEFVDYLRRKGFSIATQSRGSYSTTFLLTASIFNMQYLDFIKDGLGSDSENYDPLMSMIEKNKVTRLFKVAGYKYVHISTGDVVYGNKKGADYEFTGGWIDDLPRLVMMTTVLRPLAERFRYKRQTVLDAFNKLREVPDMDLGGPKFVLAHIMSPHQPYFFGPNGEIRNIDKKGLGGEETMKYYLDQLIYDNKLLRETVEQILAKSKKPPVIIIQSDNGFFVPEELYGKNNAISRGLMNFSAYYLPGYDKNELPLSMTNVNTFRFIFNHYLGTNLEILPNHSYASTPQKPYDFKEILNFGP